MKLLRESEIWQKVKSAGGYLLLRTFKIEDEDSTDLSDSDILKYLINSKYHLWRGEEEPNGLTIHMSDLSKNWILSNVKVYGPFDNNKIQTFHYIKKTKTEFFEILRSAFAEWAYYDKDFISESENILSELVSEKDDIYFLNLTIDENPEMLSEFNVFDFFYVFVAINSEEKKVIQIEYGLD